MSKRCLSCTFLALFLAACAESPVQPSHDEHLDHTPSFARAEDNSATQNRINAAIRRSTARYQQVHAAIADGYELASACVPGMGYHYLKAALVDGAVEPARPEVLVYEPQKSGRLRLVAVEFIVPAAAWDPFNEGPPMLGSRVFDDHRPEGSGGPPFPHYQLHAWVWMNNPSGIYSPFNQNASCQFES